MGEFDYIDAEASLDPLNNSTLYVGTHPPDCIRAIRSDERVDHVFVQHTTPPAWFGIKEQNNAYKLLHLLCPNLGPFLSSTFTLYPNFRAWILYILPVLVESYRALKTTGTLAVHCPVEVEHIYRTILDQIGGPGFFQSSLVWDRGYRSVLRPPKKFVNYGDRILVCAMPDMVFRPHCSPHTKEYLRHFTHHDGDGQYYRLQPLTGTTSDEPGEFHGRSEEKWMQPWTPKSRPHVTYHPRPGRPWMIPEVDDPNIQGDPIRMLDWWDEQGDIYHPPGGQMPSYKQYRSETFGKYWGDILRPEKGTAGVLAETKAHIDADVDKIGGVLRRILQCTVDPDETMPRVLFPLHTKSNDLISKAAEMRCQWFAILPHGPKYLSDFRERVDGDTYKEDWHPMTFDDAVMYRDKVDNGARKGCERVSEEWFLRALTGLVSAPRPKDMGADRAFRYIHGSRALMILVSIKSGAINLGQLRDLVGTMSRSDEHADLGILLSWAHEKPSKGMLDVIAQFGRDFLTKRIEFVYFKDLIEGRWTLDSALTWAITHQVGQPIDQLCLVPEPGVEAGSPA